MTYGIYCYYDTENDNKIVYVGKDSHIEVNKRNKDHLKPSNRNLQKINQILQDDPNRYGYKVICKSDYYSHVYLNCLEKGLIKVYNPKFCFTDGGDGINGWKQSDEVKKLISEVNTKNYPRIIKNGFYKGNQVYAIVFKRKVLKTSINRDDLESFLDNLQINGEYT